MKTIEDFQSEKALISEKINEAVKNEIELRFRFMSEDVHKWLQEGGCLECNGAGVQFPWKDCMETIECPACDGTSPAYSLSCMNQTIQVDSPYFPEAHYGIIEAAAAHHRQKNRTWTVPLFWTPDRVREKVAAAKATHSLRLDMAAIEDNIRTAKLTANNVAPVTIGLPDLSGVSPRQVGFGKACRNAAIACNHIAEAEAAKFHDSCYWIDNFKHLLGR